jgi:hypothetical protein
MCASLPFLLFYLPSGHRDRLPPSTSRKVPPAFPSAESPQHIENECVIWSGSTSPDLPALALLDPAVEGIDQMVEAAGLRWPLQVRSQKPEGPTDDRQKPEDGNAAERVFLLASGFLLLASDFRLPTTSLSHAS